VRCGADAATDAAVYLTSLKLLLNLAVDVDGVLVGGERLVDVTTDQLAGSAVVECDRAGRIHVLHKRTHQPTLSTLGRHRGVYSI